MSRLFACLLAGVGLLVTVPATPALADDGDECTRSSWRSTLKPKKWIIQRESSFSPTAANPTSSAFGLGQLILANRRRYAPQVGADPADEGYHTGATDPCEQLRCGSTSRTATARPRRPRSPGSFTGGTDRPTALSPSAGRAA